MVPNCRTSNRKSPTSVDVELTARHDPLAERWRWRDATSETGLRWRARYLLGCLTVQTAVRHGAQLVCLETVVEHFLVWLTTRAAALSTRCSLSVTVLSAAAWTALHCSNLSLMSLMYARALLTSDFWTHRTCKASGYIRTGCTQVH